jgi:hypothetical protein
VPAGALALLLAGCGGGSLPGAQPPRDASPSGPTSSSAGPRVDQPRSASPGPVRPALDSWRVGAQVLPRRPDGFGVVRPTPRELRVRRLPSTGALPAPPDGRFRVDQRPMTPDLARRLRLAWSPGCPVDLSDLRLLRLTFWGFDAQPHTGELVVHRDASGDVAEVFARLFAARFPIEQMRVVTQADLDAPPTGDGNNTAAYACRPSRGSTSWSAHAYGRAVDVNPFMNPYTRDGSDLVLPELASAYLDRSWRRPGMVLAGGVVTRAFARVGWTWGGTFSTVQDPMHFSADGR